MFGNILRDYRTAGLYLAPDTGGGGGGGEEPEQAPTTGDGTGAEDTPNAGQAVLFTDAQQAAVDRIIADRLQRAKNKWQADADAEKKKAAAEAEKARLKEQAEWQKLAEQHEARVAELEPLEAQVQAYAEVVEAMLTKRLEELGEKASAAVDALPGEPDALAKLAWLDANASLFEDEKPAQGTPKRGGRLSAGRKPAPSETDERPIVRW